MTDFVADGSADRTVVGSSIGLRVEIGRLEEADGFKTRKAAEIELVWNGVTSIARTNGRLVVQAESDAGARLQRELWSVPHPRVAARSPLPLAVPLPIVVAHDASGASGHLWGIARDLRNRLAQIKTAGEVVSRIIPGRLVLIAEPEV